MGKLFIGRLTRLVDRLLRLLGFWVGFLLGLRHGYLGWLLLWRLLELLLLWHYLVPLISQLLHAGIVIVGRLNGLHLQVANSCADAVDALSLHNG